MNNRKILVIMAVAVTILLAWSGYVLAQALNGGQFDLQGNDQAVGGLEQARLAAIFVPKAKGSGETLDDSSDNPVASDKADLVVTSQGDRLMGNVVSMESGGKLRLSGPQFDGEVGIVAKEVDLLALRGAEKSSGRDEILLTNGDRLVGTLSSITSSNVTLDTDAAGTLNVSLKVIRTISLGRPENILIESTFNAGRMEPWTSRAGLYQVVDNALVGRNRGNMAPLSAKLDQKEPLTFVAKVQALEGNPMQAHLVIFSDTDGAMDGNPFGRNSLFAMFNNSEVYLQYATAGGGTNMIANRSMGRSVTSGILRLAYDPASGKARMWLDSTDLGEYQVPTKPATGQFVIFNSYYPVKIEYLKVLRGIVGPSGDDESVGPAPDGTTSVQLANKDRVSATALTMANGQVVVTTSYGEIKCPPKDVARIVFNDKAQEEPRRQNGDVRVQTSVGRLTFQFSKLTADALAGRSDYLGEIKIKRSAVREIRFNLYGPSGK
jgi:hypothetical protein